MLPFGSCAQEEAIKNEYNLKEPIIMELEKDLDEISGITFLNGELYAISDDKGSIFQLDPGTGKITNSWEFSTTKDFEGLAAFDGKFYVLESNGNITKAEIINNKIITEEYEFNLVNGEFEIFYFDDKQNRFVMICKECEDDGKSSVSAFTFDPQTNSFEKAGFSVSADEVHALGNVKKDRIKASGGVKHPSSGEVYIVSSINRFLLVKSQDAKPLRVYSLDKKLFEQPEGITFNSNGDLFISNEKGGKKSATLLFFKRDGN